jgi:hypothetical protein
MAFGLMAFDQAAFGQLAFGQVAAPDQVICVFIST